jgi:hypothetical protein
MNDARERMRRIRDEEQRMNISGYSSDPWATQRLVESKPGVGVPTMSARVPRNATFEQDEQGWWINKPAYGPFQSIRDAEIAVFGSSTLSGGKRDFRDGPPGE